MDAERKPKPLDEQAEFVMSVVADSDDKRQDMESIWDEVDDNYLVRPPFGWGTGNTAYPLDSDLLRVTSARSRDVSILKDPETHQEIMTLLARIVQSCFPVDSPFISARAVGFEDIFSACAVKGLGEHAFRLPGHYWSKIGQILQALLRGTGVGRWSWRYLEEARSRRDISVNEFSGELEDSSQVLMVPVWDDPHFQVVDSRDFYPDHGQELLSEMIGCVQHFRVTASEAMRNAEAGIYERKAAVADAIEGRAHALAAITAKRTDSVADVSPDLTSHPEFMPLDAFEYVGETPFAGDDEDDFEDERGIVRRIVTVLNGQTVRSRAWPRRMPFTEIKIIPRPGSFWGVSVGELVRSDQDFLDTAKMMLADAVVRSVHPPFIYDKNQEVDLKKLRRFNPRVPIGANSVAAVATLNYSPPLNHAFQMYSGVKAQMRDASSATDAVQGQAGPDRESASGASLRYQAAQGRPELFSQVMDREWLPADGRIVIELFQEFLRDDEELRRRVGKSEYPVILKDILVDFDIMFVGSRQQTRLQKIEAFREINAASANPIVAQLVPWLPLLRKWFKEIGAEEIAAMVGNPQMIELNTLLTQVGGGQTPAQMPSAASPPGLAPAQASGMGPTDGGPA